MICFFVAILLFVALLYRHNDLALLAALVLLLMAGSKAWSLISLSRVSCSVHLDKGRAFPQETVTLTTNIENAKFLPVWVRIQWPWSSGLGSMGEASIAPQESSLLWHQRARFHRNLKALRRGVYQLPEWTGIGCDEKIMPKTQDSLNNIRLALEPDISP